MEKLRVIRHPDPEMSNGLNIQHGDIVEVLDYSCEGFMDCFQYKVKLPCGNVTYLKDYDVESLDEDNFL